MGVGEGRESADGLLLYLTTGASMPNSIFLFIDTDTVYGGDYKLRYKSNKSAAV